MITSEGLVESGTLELLPEPPAIKDNDVIYNAVLIGNTKRIWPIFINWLYNQEKRVTSPFDTYIEQFIKCTFDKIRGNPDFKAYELFWSNGKRHKVYSRKDARISTEDDTSDTTKNYHCFDTNQTSFLVSMQRVAKTTGEYWHDDEATKLCVHTIYGTWTAFRAVVVLETNDNISITVPPTPQPCLCPVSDVEIKKAKRIFDHALQLSSSDEQGYGSTLNKSWAELCKYLHNTVCSGSDWDKVPSTMKPWIQLRDVITVGRESWKYYDAQLLYHYTKDPEILSNELERVKNNTF